MPDPPPDPDEPDELLEPLEPEPAGCDEPDAVVADAVGVGAGLEADEDGVWVDDPLWVDVLGVEPLAVVEEPRCEGAAPTGEAPGLAAVTAAAGRTVVEPMSRPPRGDAGAAPRAAALAVAAVAAEPIECDA